MAHFDSYDSTKTDSATQTYREDKKSREPAGALKRLHCIELGLQRDFFTQMERKAPSARPLFIFRSAVQYLNQVIDKEP